MTRFRASVGSADGTDSRPDDDRALLRQYATSRADKPFAQLVARHIALVYSAALRRCDGDAHRAQDVVQLVFAALAKNADTLWRHPALVGWLYTATRNAALNLQIAEQRRARRETDAVMGGDLSHEPAIDWDELRTTLDAAMDELSETDRTAVLMRFFQRNSYAEIGARLNITESGARMRTERALDRLRRLLAERGITSTAAAMGSVLLREAVGAVPGGLAALVAHRALRSVRFATAAAPHSALSLPKLGWVGVGALVITAVVSIGLLRRSTTLSPASHATIGSRDATASIASDAAPAQPPVAGQPPTSAATTPPLRSLTATPPWATGRPEAIALLIRMGAAYAALSSYEDSGETRRLGARSTTQPPLLTFRIAFTRPALFRLEATRAGATVTDRLIAVGNGRETTTYTSGATTPINHSYARLDLRAHIQATDGAWLHVPRLLVIAPAASFFSLAQLQDAEVIGTADVENTPCYMVTGRHPNGNEYRLWIAQSDLLIRKIVTTLPVSDAASAKRSPPDNQPGASREEIEEIHRNIRINQNITDETFRIEGPN